MKPGTTYTLEVKLAPGVDWTAITLPGTWIRSMEPSVRVFTKDLTPAWVDSFEVMVNPFIFIHP